ncbi:hypothetical protein [Azospirillum canadense]|nr:hypothetical protein [Azospirillum canadense]MCW2239477.1 hypothetical protein [Azospirillum canadense]
MLTLPLNTPVQVSEPAFQCRDLPDERVAFRVPFDALFVHD